jgi:serine/threonine-protein kinase
MADVLLARADGIEGFERHVVLKRIREEYARDPHFIKMFLDEARVAANLHHQHIVQVNDIGEANGNFFFAMEYLHGEDVRALLSAASKARTHVPLGVVVAIGSAAAAGLHYAHERRANDKRPLNIVHCDVSPSNILVGYDGSIKVVDFGIAKAALRSDDSRYLKGKAAYVSPEQCTGGPIDRRSDVFSLGIVLYELATTTRLFKGASDALVMDAIVKGRAPLPQVRRPDLPNELSMIIMRALDTDPNRRYQTADELRAALDRFAEAAGLNTSEAAVASVLRKMFGERPEPWLDRNADDTGDARASWTELSQLGSGRAHRPSDLAIGTDRFGPVHARASAPTVEPPLPPPPLPEPQPAPAPRKARPKKLVLGAAAIAAVGVAAIAVAASGGDREAVPAGAAATQTAASASAVTAPPPAAEPPSEPGRAMTVARPGDAEEMPAVSAQSSKSQPGAAANASAARRVTGVAGATRSATPNARAAGPAAPAPAASAPPARTVAAAPVPVPAPAPPIAPAAPPLSEVAEVAAAAPPTLPPSASPAPAPTPTPAAPAITAPAKPTSPATAAAPAIPQLPQGIINRVAWDHSKELARCEHKEAGRGEVTVRFHVTAAGSVTKPQIATAMGKPKLAACILRSLQKWKFPRQPAGGAQGSYTVIF